jgi:hypothetical protein
LKILWRSVLEFSRWKTKFVVVVVVTGREFPCFLGVFIRGYRRFI